MGKGYKCGGAGSGLDFRIQIYPTQEAMTAAAPANKTFGIITDAYTGWSIDRFEPAEPAVGLLWIETGMSSLGAINALAYNSIQIRPIAAHQYTADGWVDRHGETFLDGTWVNWEPETVYLFRAGDQNVEITGGWTDVDPASETIYRSYAAQQSYGASVSSQTLKSIDLSNFTILRVVLDNYNERFSCYLKDLEGKTISSVTASEPGELIMSIGNVSGSYFICFESSSSDYGNDQDGHYVSTHFTISEVQLLKNDPVQEMQKALAVLGVEV